MIEAKVESQDTDAAGDVEAEAEVKEEELAEEKPTQTGDTSDTASFKRACCLVFVHF